MRSRHPRHLADPPARRVARCSGGWTRNGDVARPNVTGVRLPPPRDEGTGRRATYTAAGDGALSSPGKPVNVIRLSAGGHPRRGHPHRTCLAGAVRADAAAGPPRAPPRSRPNPDTVRAQSADDRRCTHLSTKRRSGWCAPPLGLLCGRSRGWFMRLLAASGDAELTRDAVADHLASRYLGQ
jgi:hypothetical protein